MSSRRGALTALTALALALACSAEAPAPAPGPILRDCRLKVSFRPLGLPGFVGVGTDADGQDAHAHPMRRDPDGVWRAALSLPPGLTLYRIEVDGRPALDADNPLTARRDGAQWSAAYVQPCDAPALRLIQRRARSATLRLQRLTPEAGLSAVTARADGHPLPTRQAGDEVELSFEGLAPGKYAVEVLARDAQGAEARLSAPVWVDETPWRWEDALIYEVMIDRFAAERPFSPAVRLRARGLRAGGTLRGLTAKLRAGYFQRLGVNVLWISPLNRNAEGLHPGAEGGPARYEAYHGYWPVAPREVEPALGDAADVETLVAEAHARGVRVILDVVLNHVHADHPYATEHPEWFNPPCVCGTAACPWSTHIERCWFAPYLPDLSWATPDALQVQVADALWWLRRFDLDGLRVDAVPMMPRFVTRHLTYQVHRQREGLRERSMLLGETFTGPGGQADIRRALGPDGLDGQFDFPVMWALRAAFAWEQGPLWELADAWLQSEEAWAGSAAVMGQFVGNHDVTRFLSEAAGQSGDPWGDRVPLPDADLSYQRLLLAQTFVLTVPGAPVLYQGDEMGMPGLSDPDNRRPMRFDGERSARESATFESIARIGRLRRCLPALRRAPLRLLRLAAERLIYLRDLGDGAPALVVLQRGPEDLEVRAPLPPDAPGGPWLEILSGRRVARTADGLAPFHLAPRTPAVLIPADDPCTEEP